MDLYKQNLENTFLYLFFEMFIVHFIVKVVIRGDRNTGKSCLLYRMQGKSFTDSYIPTNEIQVGHILWTYPGYSLSLFLSLEMLFTDYDFFYVAIIVHELLFPEDICNN